MCLAVQGHCFFRLFYGWPVTILRAVKSTVRIQPLPLSEISRRNAPGSNNGQGRDKHDGNVLDATWAANARESVFLCRAGPGDMVVGTTSSEVA